MHACRKFMGALKVHAPACVSRRDPVPVHVQCVHNVLKSTRVSRTMAARRAAREARAQAKQLKAHLYGLMAQPGSAGGGADPLDDLNAAREMAFVITDLEASTAMANADGAAFAKVQDIHDMVRTRLVWPPMPYPCLNWLVTPPALPTRK